MARKKRYLEVYLDPRLESILQECLEANQVKRELITRRLKSDASGVAKLAVYRFLEDMGKIPRTGKHNNNKDA